MRNCIPFVLMVNHIPTTDKATTNKVPNGSLIIFKKSAIVFSILYCYGGFLFFKELPLLIYHLTFTLTEESADAVAGYNPMTWHFWSKRIAPEGLTDSLRTPAAYSPGKFAVGYRLTARDIQ